MADRVSLWKRELRLAGGASPGVALGMFACAIGIGAFAAVTNDGAQAFGLGCAAAGLAVYAGVMRARNARLLGRVALAFVDNDLDRARETLTPALGADAARAHVACWAAHLQALRLEAEGRYGDALAALASIEGESSANHLVQLLLEDDRAWMLAHLGEPERAVELAERALVSATGRRFAPAARSLVQTLGVAQTIAGRHDAAIPNLVRSLKALPDAASIGRTSYYLARARLALGDLALAKIDLGRCCARGADARYRDLAKRELERLAGPPYRS